MAAVTSRAAKPLAAAAIAQLEADGVATLIGTVVNPAGLTHAKTVPLRRMGAFADPVRVMEMLSTQDSVRARFGTSSPSTRRASSSATP